jgi:hypothetical protein
MEDRPNDAALYTPQCINLNITFALLNKEKPRGVNYERTKYETQKKEKKEYNGLETSGPHTQILLAVASRANRL